MPRNWFYLDALSDLVASYEDEHHIIGPASDADMLRHLMEAKGVSQADLSRESGISRSTVSEVLAGKKPFSRQLIRKLASYFQVDASLSLATSEDGKGDGHGDGKGDSLEIDKAGISW